VLVLFESCAIALLGGGIGLGLAYLLTLGGDPTNGLFPSFFIPSADMARGRSLPLVSALSPGSCPPSRRCACASWTP